MELERVRGLADTDELTGLLNRRGWNRLLDLEQARFRRVDDAAAVLVLVVDNLMGVNGRQGHHTEDELLQTTARTVTAATRDTDIVARRGGDEYGFLTIGTNSDHTDGLVTRLHRALDDAGIAV